MKRYVFLLSSTATRTGHDVFAQAGTSPSSSNAVSGTVMKPKPAVKVALMSAEAEALRRDPFKNYSEEERPDED